MNKHLLTLAAGAVLAQFSAAQAAPVVNPANGHTYDAISGVFSWTEAKAAAEAMGGHLATLTSADENAFIVGAFPDAFLGGYWLGGFQPPGTGEPADGWEWVTGEAWSYTNWAPGAEPNDCCAGEDVLHFDVFSAGSGTWNDLGDGPFSGYVVEFPGARVPEAGMTLGLLAMGAAALGFAGRRGRA